METVARRTWVKGAHQATMNPDFAWRQRPHSFGCGD